MSVTELMLSSAVITHSWRRCPHSSCLLAIASLWPKQSDKITCWHTRTDWIILLSHKLDCYSAKHLLHINTHAASKQASLCGKTVVSISWFLTNRQTQYLYANIAKHYSYKCAYWYKIINKHQYCIEHDSDAMKLLHTHEHCLISSVMTANLSHFSNAMLSV